MKQMKLQAVIRRRRLHLQYQGKRQETLPNIMNRNFKADRPDQKWVTDITYLIFNGRRMYLSVILDLFNNEVTIMSVSNPN